MHLEANPVGIGDNRHIAGNNRRHAGLFRRLEEGVHLPYLIIIYNSINCEIGADT